MEQDGRNERGAIGDQEAHIRQLEAANRKLRRANEILKTPSAPRDACPADLVNRRFVARGLNELWVADIPYARAGRLGLRLFRHQRAPAAAPPAPPGGRVPGPRGYRQRLWPCRANIQPDDRRAGREEGGTRLKPLPSPPRARPAERQSITHLPQNQARSIAPHPYSPIITMVIHRP